MLTQRIHYFFFLINCHHMLRFFKRFPQWILKFLRSVLVLIQSCIRMLLSEWTEKNNLAGNTLCDHTITFLPVLSRGREQDERMWGDKRKEVLRQEIRPQTSLNLIPQPPQLQNVDQINHSHTLPTRDQPRNWAELINPAHQTLALKCYV